MGVMYGDISHSMLVPSEDPEARVVPSGENDTERIRNPYAPQVWRYFRACRHIPQLHRFNLHDPEARVVPSGENDTEVTLFVCPFKSVAIFVSVATSHNFTVPS